MKNFQYYTLKLVACRREYFINNHENENGKDNFGTTGHDQGCISKLKRYLIVKAEMV